MSNKKPGGFTRPVRVLRLGDFEHRPDVDGHTGRHHRVVIKTGLEVELSAFHVPRLDAVGRIAVVVDKVGKEHHVYAALQHVVRTVAGFHESQIAVLVRRHENVVGFVIGEFQEVFRGGRVDVNPNGRAEKFAVTVKQRVVDVPRRTVQVRAAGIVNAVLLIAAVDVVDVAIAVGRKRILAGAIVDLEADARLNRRLRDR